jgi:hypothetical protein
MSGKTDERKHARENSRVAIDNMRIAYLALIGPTMDE